MKYPRWLALVLFCLLVPQVYAQFGGSAGVKTGSVHIHVVYGNDRKAGSNLLVCLMAGGSSTPVERTYTNDEGKADFRNIPPGNYHVVVSGEGIETTESPVFEVDSRQVTQAQYVTVQQIETAGPKPTNSRAGTVSAADLSVPSKARKQFDNANEAIARREWNKAEEMLNKAIASYPQYVAAYNNLGVVYAWMNDPAREQQALEKALSLDEHYVPACDNLAKLYLRQKNFSGAEALLGKALSVDPNNGQSLTLMADTQYMERHYDAAIATAQKVHALPNEHPSAVHYIAGKAYEQENRKDQALAEFQMFLKEEPSGLRADRVRSDIVKMQNPSQ